MNYPSSPPFISSGIGFSLGPFFKMLLVSILVHFLVSMYVFLLGCMEVKLLTFLCQSSVATAEQFPQTAALISTLSQQCVRLAVAPQPYHNLFVLSLLCFMLVVLFPF